MKVIEELEKIQKEFCYTRCKWLEKVNKAPIHSLDELEKLTATLQEICKECPLKRL